MENNNNNNNNFYYVMHYDFEDPDFSDIVFIGTTADECYEYINSYFQDYLDYEWDDEDEPLDAKKVGDEWLRLNLHLEIRNGFNVTKSESFINLINV